MCITNHCVPFLLILLLFLCKTTQMGANIKIVTFQSSDQDLALSDFDKTQLLEFPNSYFKCCLCENIFLCACLDFFGSPVKQDVIFYFISGNFKQSNLMLFKTLGPLNNSPQNNNCSNLFKFDELRLILKNIVQTTVHLQNYLLQFIIS